MAHDNKFGTLAERYKAFDNRRSAKMNRSREYAKLTIPGLLPDQSKGGDDALPVPYSSMPAEGVTALSARMVSVLYPLNNVPFFELGLDDQLEIEGEDTTQESAVLTRIAKRAMKQLQPTNLRSALYVVQQHLQVIGDVLLFQKDNYDFQVYRLDQYVVRRTPDGEWREIIVQEWVDSEYLPEEIRNFPHEPKKKNAGLGPDNDLEAIYTQIKWNDEEKRYDVKREFREKTFDDDTFYKVSPYFPLRWTAVAGEDYGRSLIEDAHGDVRMLDMLRKALVDGSIMNATAFWGINPGGITEMRDFDNAVNGMSISAVEGDIFAIQATNQAQVQTTLSAIDALETRLGRRFLMESVVQPQGERVTAIQIRRIAAELEQALGGALSIQSRDILIPMIRRTLYKMAVDEIITVTMAEFISDADSILKLTVRAGLEVLQREATNEKLLQIAQVVSQLPSEAQATLIWPAWMEQFMVSFGIETVGLIKTPDMMEAERQAAIEEQRAAQAEQAGQQALATAAQQQAQGAS